MTQESPLRLCFGCRQPLKDGNKINNEWYCLECGQKELRRITNQNND